MDTRTLDRVTAFTDAAVAIALTLLVLPLAGIAREAPHATVMAMFGDYADEFFAFLLSFFVVVVYWRVHRRLFEHLVRLDEPLLVLNILWLLGVVFVPVPTAVLTFEGEVEHSAAMLYLLNLLFISLMLLGMSVWVARRPALRVPDATVALRRHVRRGVVACAVLAVAALLALPWGSYALVVVVALPLGQAVVQRVERRVTVWHDNPSRVR